MKQNIPLPEQLHRVNTTSTKDFTKYAIQNERIMIIRVNLLILREIFNLIKDKRTKSPVFYSYLVDKSPKKAEAYYNTLVANGCGDYEKVKDRFVTYGISPEYFAEQYIDANETILKHFKLFCQDSSKLPMNQCKKVLLQHIFSVKNLDGTLIIDCLKNLQMDIINIPEYAYTLSDKIADIVPTAHYSQKQILDYYKKIVKENASDENTNISLPNLPESKISDKKIAYYTQSDKISSTLLLIRETYRLFAMQDEMPYCMKAFYSYLEIPENEYQNMIDGGIITTKHLLKQLEPFKYPATLFRSDNPSDIDVSKEIMDACLDYKQGLISIEEFQALLKINIYYKISTDNIGLVFPTYSLVNEIRHTISLAYYELLTEE